jgi:hypothetical protein
MSVKSMKAVALTLLSNPDRDPSISPVGPESDTGNEPKRRNSLHLDTIGRYEIWQGRSCIRVHCGEFDERPAEFGTFGEALAYARGETERDMEELQRYLAIRTPRTPALPPKPARPRKSAR